MTVKEIIITACDIMQENDLAEKILKSSELTDDESALKNELLRCLNFVQNEIATEFIPLVKVEKIKSENKEFLLSTLSEKIAYIISLKDEEGSSVKYKIAGNKLIFDGRAVISYCYCPKKVQIDDECEIMLPERVIATGVLREYYLLQGMSSEASVFEERFKNSLLNFSRKRSEKIMPKRNWK